MLQNLSLSTTLPSFMPAQPLAQASASPLLMSPPYLETQRSKHGCGSQAGSRTLYEAEAHASSAAQKTNFIIAGVEHLPVL